MAAPDPTDVGRKLRQHDNEFEAVYDLLRVIDGKIDTLDAKVALRIDTLDAKVALRIDTLDLRIGTLDRRIDTLDAKVDAGFERLQNGQQQILDLLRRRLQDDTTTS